MSVSTAYMTEQTDSDTHLLQIDIRHCTESNMATIEDEEERGNGGKWRYMTGLAGYC